MDEDKVDVDKWVDEILSALPTGHPHVWNPKVYDNYEQMVNELPMEVFVKLDDSIFTRDCTIKGCEQIHMSASDYLDMGEFTSDIDNWEVPDEKPAGQCEDWCRGPGHPKEEYPTHYIDCPAASGAPEGTVGLLVHDEEKFKQGDPDIDPTKDPCNCQGPGHPQRKFSAHVKACPQWVKPKYGSTYKPKPSCKHDREKEPFKLNDDLTIKALAYRDVKFIDDQDSDIGVYLYHNWQYAVAVTPGLEVPWGIKLQTKQVIIDWPDFKIPAEEVPMVEIVRWMLDEMRGGKRFETACMGGHGRTGTMLACLLVAQGVPPGTAINRVRTSHCQDAIENSAQGEYVADFWKLYHGNEDWRKIKNQEKKFKKAVRAGHKNYGFSGGGSYGFNGKGWDDNSEIASAVKAYDSKLGVWISKKHVPGWTWDKNLKAYTSKDLFPK